MYRECFLLLSCDVTVPGVASDRVSTSLVPRNSHGTYLRHRMGVPVYFLVLEKGHFQVTEGDVRISTKSAPRLIIRFLLSILLHIFSNYASRVAE